MNGWEMLYEALRYYASKPESAICRDFIAILPFVESLNQFEAKKIWNDHT